MRTLGPETKADEVAFVNSHIEWNLSMCGALGGDRRRPPTSGSNLLARFRFPDCFQVKYIISKMTVGLRKRTERPLEDNIETECGFQCELEVLQTN